MTGWLAVCYDARLQTISPQKRGLPAMEHCFGELPVCAAHAVLAMGRRKLMH